MNGYNNKTGVFKAPQSGVYLFMYFIEISGEYGKVELRLNNNSISATSLYGRYIDIVVTGNNHNVSITFESTKGGKTETVPIGQLNCLGDALVVTGSNNTGTVRSATSDSCPCKGRVKATGGNSVVVSVNTGDEVWIQRSGWRFFTVRPYGTTFTGILLT